MKRGISLASLTVVIIILVILAGIIVGTGIESIDTTTINIFATEILDVQNAVWDYESRYEKYPSLSDYVLDVNNVDSNSLDQFADEDITEDKINFKVVNLSEVGITDTQYGKGEETDVYVLSEKTGNVYYIKGLEYNGVTYYTLTQSLKEKLNITIESTVYSKDIKINDVIFTPSQTEVTNKPVTVKVKVPKDATISDVATTNLKSVSKQIVDGNYIKLEVNTTSEDKTGNYKITVNYIYNDVSKIAEYEVNNFSATLPIITYQESVNGESKTITVTVDGNGSDVKVIKYEKEIVSSTAYFENYGKILTSNQFVIGKDEDFTIYAQTKTGAENMLSNMPEELGSNVVDIVDGVPIPKGFVASTVEGENKKDKGLVIYEGTEYVTKVNVDEARRERNQYVWVPVENYLKFKRGLYNNTTLQNTLGASGMWEVAVDMTTNIPLPTQDSLYMTITTPAGGVTNTLDEVQALYASVKKYKGFYVARYEAGIDKQRMAENYTVYKPDKIYSVMGKIPYTYIMWSNSSDLFVDTGGAVEEARRVYKVTDSSFGVASTLIYGVQWDAVLQWYLNTNAITSVTESTSYGNYEASIINNEDLNEGAMYAVYSTNAGTIGSYQKVTSETKKAAGEAICFSTGAVKYANVNNIYDMAGNVMEWDMEGTTTTHRIYRGGRFVNAAYGVTNISHRGSNLPNVANINGFRIALYIK